jgi:hypothetical protein
VSMYDVHIVKYLLVDKFGLGLRCQFS